MRAKLEAFCLAQWQKRGWFARLMWPLSKLFGALVGLRFGLYMLGYKPHTRLPVSVIVVGNIYIGGTGKTPFVISLIEALRAVGYHPGVITRGYGRVAESVQILDVHSLAQDVGDEALLIAQRAACPVAVGRERVAAAQALLANEPKIDILISDDGLQHYALARDIEILMFDARGIGNGWLLPAGPLRETAYRRRDFTILNSTAFAVGVTDAFQMRLHAGLAWKLSEPTQCKALSEFAGHGIYACAGIGHPERFFGMLRGLGLGFEAQALSDHHAYVSTSFVDIHAEVILITEKDAVKCRQIPALYNDARIWVVPVTAQLEPEFAAALLDMIAEKKHGRTPA